MLSDQIWPGLGGWREGKKGGGVDGNNYQESKTNLPYSSLSFLMLGFVNPFLVRLMRALAAASSLDASTVLPIPWKTTGGTVHTAKWVVYGSDSVR